MTSRILAPETVAEAGSRIAPFINQTPVLASSLLNAWLGHEIKFKVEGFQKVGAFKIRGALNTLLVLKEQNALPAHVVTFSSGNHAQAVAYAARLLGIRATILVPRNASIVKRQATAGYGAAVVVTDGRAEAEERVGELVAAGAYLIHPYDNDTVIAGQGTACLEALRTGIRPDAVFATCGGGGWLSGTYLATRLLSPQALVFGVEPSQANDAAQSYRCGSVIRLDEPPQTIADGARTLSVSERTFQYLQRLADFYEAKEHDIVYWTQWLTHLLKTPVEPTSAVAMVGAFEWLRSQPRRREVLVMLSGGNIAPATHEQIWSSDFLVATPDQL